MPLKKLITLLEKSKVKYTVVAHRKVFTAFDAAQTQKLDLKTVAKTLLIKCDASDYVLAVVPASKNLDVAAVKKTVNVARKKEGTKLYKKCEIAREALIIKRFTKTLMPPFGSLWKLPTIVDRSLTKGKVINCNAGSFTESLMIKPNQYLKAERPILATISKKRT